MTAAAAAAAAVGVAAAGGLEHSVGCWCMSSPTNAAGQHSGARGTACRGDGDNGGVCVGGEVWG